LIWTSLNTAPNAGMEPILPFLMRSMMNSSLRSVFDSFGPLPAARPPSWWQKPQVVANICSPSISLDEASGCAGGLADPAGVGCSAPPAVGRPRQIMASKPTTTHTLPTPPPAPTPHPHTPTPPPPTPTPPPSPPQPNTTPP